MKNYLLLSLCCLALIGCSNNSSRDSGYISENVSLYDPKIVLDYLKKNKITPDAALNSIDSLQKAFKSSYIGYNLKKSLINKSGDEIFNECKNNLTQNPDFLSSYELYDYILQCLAGFKDSHINLSRMITHSFVSTGVSESRMIDNKLYISRIRPGLIKKIEELQKLREGHLSEKLIIGTEVVLIDGETPQTQINALKKYISASSDLALQNDAVSALFLRRFAYPAKASMTLTLKLADASITEVTLPWVQILNSANPGSLESRVLLSERGIIKSSDLDPDTKFVRSKGADLSLPLFKNLENSRTYQDSDENDALVTGIAKLQNKNYCYLQLNSFDFDSDEEFGFKIFENINDKTYPLSLPVVLKNFLQSCEAFQAPLVFDLRNNGGGNALVADFVFTMFETEKTKITYRARSLLTDVGNLSLLIRTFDAMDNLKTSIEDTLTFQSMNEALVNNSSVTSWVLTKNMKLPRGLFTHDVFMLTSPDCVSACESTANRFKKSGRAKIIGEATNGTGFGFSSNGKGKTNFRDPLNLFEVQMPNQAFQSAVVANDSDFKNSNDTKAALLAFDQMSVLENNPVTPNFEIKYSLADVMGLGDYSGYIENLKKILIVGTEEIQP